MKRVSLLLLAMAVLFLVGCYDTINVHTESGGGNSTPTNNQPTNPNTPQPNQPTA